MNATHRVLHPQYRLHRSLNRLRIVLAPPGWLNRLDSWVFLCVHALTAFALAALQFCDPNGQTWTPPWAEFVGWIYKYRLAICLVVIGNELALTGVHIVLAWLTPIGFSNAKSVLDALVGDVFDKQELSQHRYRATFFQILGWSWLTGQWVGIVCRSGEHYEGSNTIFFIDQMHPERSTGWVGRCFEASGQTVLTESPLPVDDPVSYLETGRLSIEEHRNLHVNNACLLYATGIRRNGRLWGFLVLDTTDSSRVQTSTQSQRKLRESLDRWAFVLGLTIR